MQAGWDIVIYRHSAFVKVFLKPCGQTIAGAAAQDVQRVEWRTVRGSSHRFEVALNQINKSDHRNMQCTENQLEFKLWSYSKGKF